MKSNSFSICWFVILGLVMLSAFCAEPGEPALTADRSAEENFLLRTANGDDHTGPLSKIGADWSIRFGGTRPVLRAGKDVVSLQRRGAELPPHPLRAQIIFSNGDRLAIDLKSGLRFADERIQATPAEPVRPGQGAELRLPFIFVAALWIRTPDKTLQPEKRLRQFLRADRPRDVVLLRNGDHIEGTVLQLNSRTACKIQLAGKIDDVPFDRIAAIAFKSGSLIRPPEERFGHVVLADGSRLSLLSAETDAAQKKLTGTSLYRFPLEVPLAHLISLDMRLGAAVYLSDLKPAKYEHDKFFSVPWPYAEDSNVVGLGLHLKGLGTFDKGLGLHNGSRLTYNLDGKYQRFEAWVGLDPRSGAKGSARIIVLADEKTVFDSKKDLTAADPPMRILADVREATTLTLRVNYGWRGDVQGHVNWGAARLLKYYPGR